MSLQLLGTIASSISLLHVIPQTLKTVKTKDVSSYSKPSVLLGILSTLVWMYMYYKQKLHIPIAVSLIYVLIDLYVISLIVKEENNGSNGQ
jgi:uncharacterized protein with PQ loop repeat